MLKGQPYISRFAILLFFIGKNTKQLHSCCNDKCYRFFAFLFNFFFLADKAIICDCT